jgi:hypothetical protein
MYIWTNDLANQGKTHMEKKNVKFTKDGMKVGVKEMSEEEYADRTQRCVYSFSNPTTAIAVYWMFATSVVVEVVYADCECEQRTGQYMEPEFFPGIQEQALEQRRAGKEQGCFVGKSIRDTDRDDMTRPFPY